MPVHVSYFLLMSGQNLQRHWEGDGGTKCVKLCGLLFRAAIIATIIKAHTNELFSEKRVRLSNEIVPISTSQTGPPQHGSSEHAVDLDLMTYSDVRPGSEGVAWFQVSLGQVHCVSKVIRYGERGKPLMSWNCSETNCLQCKEPFTC